MRVRTTLSPHPITRVVPCRKATTAGCAAPAVSQGASSPNDAAVTCAKNEGDPGGRRWADEHGTQKKNEASSTLVATEGSVMLTHVAGAAHSAGQRKPPLTGRIWPASFKRLYR